MCIASSSGPSRQWHFPTARQQEPGLDLLYNVHGALGLWMRRYNTKVRQPGCMAERERERCL